MLIGAHMSIAGGVENALFSAAKYGFPTIAVFVRNQRQWNSTPLTEASVRRFKLARRKYPLAPIVAHGSYLVNLAGNEEIRRKSLIAATEELDRCGRLGIEYLVMHPGSNSHTDRRIELIAAGLNKLLADYRRRTPAVLLETTSGAGFGIGGSFEQLAAILRRLKRPGRFGVCLDTCHIFAAGYDIRTPQAYRETMKRFDEIIGLGRLKAIHMNDSLGELGSRRDRHAHIGKGKIGKQGFANFLRDNRLTNVPMILETPKGTDTAGQDWDAVNAAALRSLAEHPHKRRTTK